MHQDEPRMFLELGAKGNLLMDRPKYGPGFHNTRPQRRWLKMASNRGLLFIAAWVLLLGVPGWAAQNSPAQDVLQDTQVQDSSAQDLQAPDSPMQDSQTQDMQRQDSQSQDMQSQNMEAQDSQEQNTYRNAPQRSSVPVSRSHDNHAARVAKTDPNKPVPRDALANPVLWQQPEDISRKDLFYGQGCAHRQPRPPFTFIREETVGHSPKFDCRDANNKKWRVKLGDESRPEVVASRLMWAIGYFVNDDYVLPRAEIRGLKIQRGKHRGTM